MLLPPAIRFPLRQKLLPARGEGAADGEKCPKPPWKRSLSWQLRRFARVYLSWHLLIMARREVRCDYHIFGNLLRGSRSSSRSSWLPPDYVHSPRGEHGQLKGGQVCLAAGFGSANLKRRGQGRWRRAVTSPNRSCMNHWSQWVKALSHLLPESQLVLGKHN